MRYELSDDDVARLHEALDSHEYWQLSEVSERNNAACQVGDDHECGDSCARDERENDHAEIRRCRELAERLTYPADEYGNTGRVIALAKDLLDRSSCSGSVDCGTAVELAEAVLTELGDGVATCKACVSSVPRPLTKGLCENCFAQEHNELREAAQFSPVREGDV